MSSLSEGDLYEIVDKNRIYSYEDVKIEGTVDSTLEFVRGGLQAINPQQWHRSGSSGEKRARSEYEEAFLHIASVGEEDVAAIVALDNTEPPVSRAHVRILMRTWGWPLKFFKDLPEFLTVVRDSIKGEC